MLLRRTGKKKRYSHMDRKVEQFELKLTHVHCPGPAHTGIKLINTPAPPFKK